MTLRFLSALVLWSAVVLVALAAQPANRQDIPRTWDDDLIGSIELPLANAAASPIKISSDYYYKIPERTLYKTYPVYAPGHEPAGYIEWLKRQAPQVTFDPATLHSEADWIRAGEVVFDTPNAFSELDDFYEVRNPDFYKAVNPKVTRDGVLPYLAYVVRAPGHVEVGRNGCVTCHARLMPDESVIKGAQGDWPFDRAQAFASRNRGAGVLERQLFGTPWLQPDPHRFEDVSSSELALRYSAIPPGVLARQGTSIYHPVQIPDLIGLKDRKYFDHTGLVQHRSIGHLMRYAALNQGADMLSAFAGFVPQGTEFKSVPPPERIRPRYSDAQLYALAKFVYSLKPPPNPNPFGEVAKRGQATFARERCVSCHTPPLYTNNKLTPAAGFSVPEEHRRLYDVTDVSVGTDPFLALKTRRGTGYYKVPSLKGVWYRSPLSHDGSVATLEDWFDPNRLKNEYAPTAFKGAYVEHRAVAGHPFGLKLSADDKRCLIAFLKTL
jgi:hypothetical protein